jgi:hypothetical protein
MSSKSLKKPRVVVGSDWTILPSQMFACDPFKVVQFNRRLPAAPYTFSLQKLTDFLKFLVSPACHLFQGVDENNER